MLLKLRDYVSGAISLQGLEAAGQAHRESGTAQTQGVTGQIFTGVNRVIGLVQDDDRHAAAELCETMLLRLGADRDRLQALDNSALDRAGFDEFVTSLVNMGIETEVAAALRVNDNGEEEFVIGWIYRGKKN